MMSANELFNLSNDDILYKEILMKINNRYLIETSSGFQEFLGVRRSLNTGLIIKFIDSEIKCTKEHLFKHKDSFIKAEDLNIGDSLQNKIIVSIEESAPEYYYDPVEVQGDNTYIADELEHHNCLVIDECIAYKETITIRDDFTGEIKTLKIGDFYKEFE